MSKPKYKIILIVAILMVASLFSVCEASYLPSVEVDTTTLTSGIKYRVHRFVWRFTTLYEQYYYTIITVICINILYI